MNETLSKKVSASISLLKSVSEAYDNRPIELCYSGGKDSDVILHLARMADINFIPIYKNTTIDPPFTIRHVKDKFSQLNSTQLNSTYSRLAADL